MLVESAKTGTTGKLDTSELRATLSDNPVAFFSTLAYGLRAGSAQGYPLTPRNILMEKKLPGDTPYWRIELTFEGATRALGFDLLGDVIVGRGMQADIDLDLFKALEHGISRRHAILRPARQHLYILDADSKNGLWVNEIRLSRGQARTLESDFTLRLGRLNGTIRIIDHATLDELGKRVRESDQSGQPSTGRKVAPTITPPTKPPVEEHTTVTTVIDANGTSAHVEALRKAREQAKAAREGSGIQLKATSNGKE